MIIGHRLGIPGRLEQPLHSRRGWRDALGVVAGAASLELAGGADHLGAELAQLRGDGLVLEVPVRVERLPRLAVSRAVRLVDSSRSEPPSPATRTDLMPAYRRPGRSRR